MKELIKNINAILNISKLAITERSLPSSTDDTQKTTNSLIQITKDIELLLQSKKLIIQDDQDLFSGEWDQFIKKPLHSMEKLGHLIIKFQQRMNQV